MREILAVPGMLFAAGHAKNDIPSVLNTYAAANPGTSIRYGRELGIDTKLMRAAGERIEAALAEADAALEPVARHDTLLMVVGRGASDPDANSNVAKVARMLWEGMGFGWGETAYSGVTFPLVTPALEHAAKLGYRRIVVFPYFLFTGVLVRRIYDHADAVAAAHPDIQFVKAPYLNDHPLVLDAFADRLFEILDGTNTMNCQLCKYREQVLGFEAEVGLAQQSHHHHVEGIGTGGDAHARPPRPWRRGRPPSPRLPARRPPARAAEPRRRARQDRRARVKPATTPEDIYRQSFAAVRAASDLSTLDPGLHALALRLVHACGDPALVGDLEGSPGIAEHAHGALAAGAPVLVDAEMVVRGIVRDRLPAHNEVICTLSLGGVAGLAARSGTTRSAAAVELWPPWLDGAVVAIGNAPTALARLVAGLAAGWPRPAAILGFPVGFIGAAEAKEALVAADPPLDFVATRGRRGGSALAAAAVNAFAAP